VHYSGFSLRGSAVSGRVWLELWGDPGEDRTVEGVAARRARLEALGARLTGVLDAVHYSGFSLRGSAVSGRVWLELWGDPGEDRTVEAVAALRARLEALGARMTVLATPYEGVRRWGEISALPLMRRVKERFDPGRRMSPGRFVGGI